MKKSILKIKKYLSVENVLIITFTVLLIAAVISLAVNNGSNIYSLLWSGKNIGIFPDFFESVIEASTKNPYVYGVIYPALSYCILYPFSFLLPGEYSTISDIPVISTTIQGFVVGSFVVFSSIFLIILFSLKLSNSRISFKSLALVFLLLFSAPVIYLYERGNILFFSVIFLILFLILKDSKNIYLRELSLICLAVSANIKLLPAIFGITLIYEKRYKDALKAIAYGVILFVVPFAFMGGLEKIMLMIGNASSYNADSVNGNFGFGFKINTLSVMTNILKYFKIDNAEVISAFVSYIIIALLLISCFVLKNNLKRILALSLVVIQLLSFSYLYNAIYLIIPLMLYLKENGKKAVSIKSFIYIIMFALTFSPFPYGDIFALNTGVNMNVETLLCGSGVFLLSLSVIYSSAVQIAKGAHKPHIKSVPIADRQKGYGN